MAAITPQKPFSMIREFHLADWFTLANAVCGTGALFSVMSFLEIGRRAPRLLRLRPGAGGADLRHRSTGASRAGGRRRSPLGRELDSLADVISFGVAPAIIAYGCGMQGLYDRVVLAYFVACGVSRLARYNVTAEALSEGSGKVKYFEGTPIPTSILLVALLALAAGSGAIREDLWFGAGDPGRLQAASAGAAVRAVGLADDQPDPHPEAVIRNRVQRPETGLVSSSPSRPDAVFVGLHCARRAWSQVDGGTCVLRPSLAGKHRGPPPWPHQHRVRHALAQAVAGRSRC